MSVSNQVNKLNHILNIYVYIIVEYDWDIFNVKRKKSSFYLLAVNVPWEAFIKYICEGLLKKTINYIKYKPFNMPSYI